MTVAKLTRGGLHIRREAIRKYGGVRQASRRLGITEAALSRHMTGERLPIYKFRKIYQERLGAHPDWFDQKPTKQQLRKLGA